MLHAGWGGAHAPAAPLRSALPPRPLPPGAVAISVRMGNAQLRRRVSAALVDAMSDGARSPVLEWEKAFLTDLGVLPNPELQRVVSAVSYFQ